MQHRAVRKPLLEAGRRLVEIAEAELHLNSFADVVRWVIDELGALCPSPERLASYSADPQAVEYRDIRYHVEEAACATCRADLEAAAAKQQ